MIHQLNQKQKKESTDESFLLCSLSLWGFRNGAQNIQNYVLKGRMLIHSPHLIDTEKLETLKINSERGEKRSQ